MLNDLGEAQRRELEKDEKEGKKVSRRIHKCSKCNGWRHHRNECKEPIGVAVESSTHTRAEM